MNDDILDTQIRVIGGTTQGGGKKPGKKLIGGIILAAIALIAILIAAVALLHKEDAPEEEPGVFEQETAVAPAQTHPLEGWIAEQTAREERGVVLKDTAVNDIPLRIELPIGAKPHLAVGYDCLKDTARFILLSQAADVRADNKKIVGAFVLQGKPLSWSLSKTGYCGIVGDSIRVGVAENSPLFEEAINRGGDFFRQYPLVSEGTLVENELKTKSIRRALCELEGAIAVVESKSEESLHDFAQALVDLGVSNAIYLVGSSAIHFLRTTDGQAAVGGQWSPQVYPNVSFIIWE